MSGGPGMAGMAMGAGHAGTNILPAWLALVWTLVFVVILVIHARHVLDSHGQRKFWHAGHVVMALGMIFMFAPASINHITLSRTFWQLGFANLSGAIVAWILIEAFGHRAINVLWLAMAVDLAAMAYMWSPSGYSAPLTWLLVTYFAAQALLWVTDRMRRVDGLTIAGGSFSVALEPGGAVIATATAQPLVCFEDLRFSMFAMTIGMGYMFVAMQLLK